MEEAHPESEDTFPDMDLKDWDLQYSPFFSVEATSEFYKTNLRQVFKKGSRGYNQKLRSELTRLKSFDNFPSLSPFTPEELASAGFFSLGQKPAVQCFCCGLIVVIASFQPPQQLHLKYRQDCGFQQGLDVGNIGKYEIRVKALASEVMEVPAHCAEETWRLETFAHWPFYCETKPSLLSDCGFYYTGVKDYVRCFSCQGVLGDWEVGSDPWQEHAKWFPGCDYLRSRLPENVISQHGHSYSGFHGLTVYTGLYLKPHILSFVKNSMFEDEDSRMESFTQWPSSSTILPRQLAQAGFFYTGKEEIVQCFCCGGQISQWEETDPIQEHQNQFPQCQYVRDINLSPRHVLTALVKFSTSKQTTSKREFGHFYVYAIHGKTYFDRTKSQETLDMKATYLQALLQKAYSRREFSRTFPFSDVKIPFDTRLVYTQLAMVTKDFRNIPLHKITLSELLRQLRNITVVDGLPGSGKTSFLKKIAMLWAQGTCPLLKRFKFVLYISLKNVSKNQKVTKIISDQLLEEELDISEHAFKDIIHHYSASVLFLLDDFGRNNGPLPSLIDQELIHCNHWLNIPIIIVVRTQSLHLIRKHAQLLISIQDFPLHATIHMCRSLLSYHMDLVEDAFYRLQTFILLRPIIKTPLMGLIVCVSRIKFPARVFSIIFLFDYYLQFIKQNHISDLNIFKSAVSSLGELCLEGQFEGRFQFTADDLLQAGVKESDALELGLLNKLTSQRLRPVYSVFHVYFQDYLAALRMNELLTSSIPAEREKSQNDLKRIDSVAKFVYFKLFLLFTCTMSQTAATVIVDFVLNKLNRNTDSRADEVINKYPETTDMNNHIIQFLYEFPECRDSSVDTYLLNEVLDVLYDTQFLEICGPLIKDFMKDRTFTVSAIQPQAILRFITDYPESLTGIKSFHLHILQGANNLHDTTEELLQVEVPEEYSGLFNNSQTFQADLNFCKNGLKLLFNMIRSQIPSVIVDVWCPAHDKYKIPLVHLTFIETHSLKDSDLENMDVLFYLSESIALDLLESPGVIERMQPLLEKYAKRVKKLHLNMNRLSENEQAVLCSFTNLCTLTVMIKNKEEAPELLFRQMERFPSLQQLNLNVYQSKEFFEVLPIGFSKMRGLRKLNLMMDVTENGVILAWLLTCFPLLASFSLVSDHCPDLDAILNALPCAGLQYLKLGCITFTESQLWSFATKLGTLTNLKVLKLCKELFDSTEIMPTFVCALKELTQLETLHLPFGKGVEAEAGSIIAVLQTLTRLKSIQMRSSLNDENLVKIAKATQGGSFSGLQKLILSHNISTTDRGWQEFFHTLSSLKDLVKLNICRPLSHLLKPSSSTVIALVRAVSQLPSMRHVVVSGWLLDDMDLKVFEDMKKSHAQSQYLMLTFKIGAKPQFVQDL
uniref:Baculoviral IAP repeat-containing protein 1-like n=1 Tax=Lepisosteus oculatus TaxID=7918 RepID=W5MK06_LEPOC